MSPCKQTIDDGTDETPCNAASMSAREAHSSDNIKFQGVMLSFQNIANRILAKSAHRYAKATELTDVCPQPITGTAQSLDEQLIAQSRCVATRDSL